MAEEAPESDSPKKDVKVEAPDIESQIQTAMRSRVAHFKEQADSLTFEGVRRLLEKDLGLEAYALDVHKRFVKQCLLKSLEGVGDEKSPKISGVTGEKGADSQETEGSTKEFPSKKEIKNRCPDDEEKMEDSPVLGLLNEQKATKLETKESEGNGKKAIPSEIIIKKAIRKRASYVKENSEKVTMAGLRRLLEEDLKLDKFTLDPCKKLITQHLDEVLKSSEASEPANNAKKIVKKKPNIKAAKKVSSEESSDASDQDSEEDEEEEVKPRKRSTPKGKIQNSVESKKRKGPPEEISSKKRTKLAKKASKDSSDTEDHGKDSEDDQSPSSPEKPKKKEVSTPVYGKQVENLKSVIKACGMSVPPSIYKKVKQVPENKRETQLIKELEEILSREGLSSNPSEKELLGLELYLSASCNNHS
ncbi:nucleolin isoform X2 [Senna tora]|uniref:Nucleolin isoform X2 n=1 Tax=Senna tora TaxID=362788 RepID=A0A834TG76_9FABA|nr:nucleolin isoform X2 [Senna tora]